MQLCGAVIREVSVNVCIRPLDFPHGHSLSVVQFDCHAGLDDLAVGDDVDDSHASRTAVVPSGCY